MKIIIELDDVSAAMAALHALRSGGSPDEAPSAPATAPTPAPATAPTPAAAPAPAPSTPAAPPPSAPAPASSGMNSVKFSEAVQAYVKQHGPRGAKAKLAEFGFGRTSDVPADQYEAVAAALAV